MWRLKVAESEGNCLTRADDYVGRRYWEFDLEAGTPEERAHVEKLRQHFWRNRFRIKHSANLFMRMQLTKEKYWDNINYVDNIVLKGVHDINEGVVTNSLRRALDYYTTLQVPDGHWPCELPGPLFLGPQMVVTLYTTGDIHDVLSFEHQKEMKRYIYNHQNEDGGWGIHIEGHSTMFSSVLNYLALRLMGENLDQTAVARAQNWILDHGGALAIPAWGKYWLAEDLFHPQSSVLKLVWGCLRKMESIITRWPASVLRERALKLAMELIHYEDENSQYLCIGTVEKALSLLACWVEDPNSDAYKYHLRRIHDYLWVSEDGMTLQGSTSQCWDVALSIQAIISSEFAKEYGTTLAKAHDFLKKSQVQQNPSGDFTKMYRHASKGAWAFSTASHGWQVSDCTAEGLKAALLLSQISPIIVGEELDKMHLYDAVNIILSLQSANGGFPAWEPAKASSWLEMLNPIEFFEDTLIEREYVECTSSAIQALSFFLKLHPEFRKRDIEMCISKALRYIENNQNADGSWYGRWGVCFTYATWFAVEALVVGGRNYQNSLCIQRACGFFLSKQLPCGGWGESYLSCHNKVFTNLEGNRAHAVHTAWALLSLIKAGQVERDPKLVHQGVKVLINLQLANGDFPQQEFTGAFMRYCMLNYSSYRNIFPIWALGEYRRRILLCT
ncbi:hypothetical protein ACH5RR_019650 [Cinchona calisaya]|uniref:Terpene cyclase/mutase family member n=1 Tax=Cinchona calisaya TaxID=153742 RepID=A0ABD2ZRM3_9GENT